MNTPKLGSAYGQNPLPLLGLQPCSPSVNVRHAALLTTLTTVCWRLSASMLIDFYMFFAALVEMDLVVFPLLLHADKQINILYRQTFCNTNFSSLEKLKIDISTNLRPQLYDHNYYIVLCDRVNAGSCFNRLLYSFNTIALTLQFVARELQSSELSQSKGEEKNNYLVFVFMSWFQKVRPFYEFFTIMVAMNKKQREVEIRMKKLYLLHKLQQSPHLRCMRRLLVTQTTYVRFQRTNTKHYQFNGPGHCHASARDVVKTT